MARQTTKRAPEPRTLTREEELLLRLVSTTELARMLDITPTRVRQLVKEGVLQPPVRRNQYRMILAVRSYLAFIQRGGERNLP